MEARRSHTAAAPAQDLAGGFHSAAAKAEVVTAFVPPPSPMTMTRHGSRQQAASPPRRSCKVEAISMRGPEDEEGEGSAGADLLTTTRLNEERAHLHFMPYVM
jgi:hypothetical protein